MLSRRSERRARQAPQAAGTAGTPGTQAPRHPSPCFAPASSSCRSTSPRSTTTAGRSPTSPPRSSRSKSTATSGRCRRSNTSARPIRCAQIGAPRKVEVPDETFSSSNAKGAPSGRLIVLLVDQGNIRTGAARSSMNSAKKFVDTLTPEDRVAVIAVPGPGRAGRLHDRSRQGARSAAAHGRHRRNDAGRGSTCRSPSRWRSTCTPIRRWRPK